MRRRANEAVGADLYGKRAGAPHGPTGNDRSDFREEPFEVAAGFVRAIDAACEEPGEE